MMYILLLFLIDDSSFLLSWIDKLQRTISSYEKVKHEKDALNEEISKRESTL